MAAPKDARPTLTVKGAAFTPEFRAKINKAAKRQGQTQADFVAQVLEREATRILTGGADRPEEDVTQSPAIVARIEATDARIEALAAQVQTLTESQRRGFWARLLGG